MKKCPFCAEEIQDEAVVCRFCRKQQPRPARSSEYVAAQRAANRKVLAAVGIFAVAMAIAYLGTGGRTVPTEPQAPVLDVSGGKGALGLSVTNRESFLLSDCRVTLLERGRGDQWIATVDQIGSMETVHLTWPDFKARSGHTMPSYVGTSAKHFTIVCDGSAEKRRGAGLAF